MESIKYSNEKIPELKIDNLPLTNHGLILGQLASVT